MAHPTGVASSALIHCTAVPKPTPSAVATFSIPSPVCRCAVMAVAILPPTCGLLSVFPCAVARVRAAMTRSWVIGLYRHRCLDRVSRIPLQTQVHPYYDANSQQIVWTSRSALIIAVALLVGVGGVFVSTRLPVVVCDRPPDIPPRLPSPLYLVGQTASSTSAQWL
jgi:hypothetical protein